LQFLPTEHGDLYCDAVGNTYLDGLVELEFSVGLRIYG